LWSACSLHKKWMALKQMVDGFEHMTHWGLFNSLMLLQEKGAELGFWQKLWIYFNRDMLRTAHTASWLLQSGRTILIWHEFQVTASPWNDNSAPWVLHTPSHWQAYNISWIAELKVMGLVPWLDRVTLPAQVQSTRLRIICP
jgi:hypothetical protein